MSQEQGVEVLTNLKKRKVSFFFPDFDNMRNSKSRGYYMYTGTRHHVFDCEHNYSLLKYTGLRPTLILCAIYKSF
jgi:hypothetical protein